MPKTQKQLAKESSAKLKPQRHVTVRNVSKQMIPIQLRPPVGKDGKRLDFYVGQMTVNLKPGQSAKFVEDRVIDEQMVNLAQKGFVRVSRPSK